MDKTLYRQATASKQLDIFYKENDFLILADISLFLRLFLTTVNNLWLINNMGKMKAILNIRRPTSLEMANLFIDIAATLITIITAKVKRVKSFPLVRDVR